MQDHLCQILAHYVVYLGSQLSLPIASHVGQFILESATTRWNKEGNFEWLTIPRDELEPTASFNILPALPADDLDPFSELYSGYPSLSHENNFQPGFDSLLPMGGLDSASRLSTGQHNNPSSSFGVTRDPSVVLHDPSCAGSHQGTVPLSKAALESFNYWNSKWDSPCNVSAGAKTYSPFRNVRYAPNSSWGGANLSLTVARSFRIRP
jgi:hypothetical protein